MTCGNCGRELDLNGEDMIVECPYCYGKLNTGDKSVASPVKNSVKPIVDPPKADKAGKGFALNALALAFVGVEYLVWTFSAFSDDTEVGLFFMVLGGSVVVAFAGGIIIKGLSFPVFLLSGLNIFLLYNILGDNHVGEDIYAVIFFVVANVLLLKKDARAWRAERRKLVESLKCPHCGSELPNENVRVCSKCGRDIKVIGNSELEKSADAVDAVEIKLTQLKQLKEKGLLTDEEYEQKRSAIVEKL